MIATVSREIANIVAGLVRPAFVQTAALCTRDGPSGVEVLMIRTLTRKLWVIPKGWPMKGKTLAEAAAQEAWEEAGVRGRLEPDPIGAFTYTRIKKTGLPVQCRAQVFRLHTTEVADVYPECTIRTRVWLSPAKAAARASIPELKALLQRL